MAKYAILICGVDIDSHRGDHSQGNIVEKYDKWATGFTKIFLDGIKLKDGEGFRVGRKNDRIFDGPFTETKETISGLFLIEAKDYNEALAIARECPAVLDQGGFVEVREAYTCPGAERKEA